MTNHLSSGRVNISLLQDHLRTELLNLIDKCDGTKTIVWDEALAGPVGLIAKYKILLDHDVKRMYPLKCEKLPVSNEKNIIFISRPLLHLVDIIADIVREEERSGLQKFFYLFFIPRQSQLCEKRLQTKGVFGNFQLIADLPYDIFPFDNDFLSMEVESTFRDLYLEKDPTSLFQAAQAIMTLQSLYGVIPKISGKGLAAHHVRELLSRLDLEPRTYPNTSQIDHLILLDRAIDLISPLATQLTYEGLIDEIFEIKNTTAHFPSEKFVDFDDEPTDIMSDRKQVILNSADELFAEIRDKNFKGIGAALSKTAKIISSQFDEKPGTGVSIDKMKQFVAKLPHLLSTKKLLSIHTTIAELIKKETDTCEFLDSLQLEHDLLLGVDTDKVQPYIEDCIAHQEPLIKVLRLICIQSATNSGLKQKVLDHYKREIIQTYGFKHILTLTNLEDAGLLKVQQGSRSYTVLKKTLRLTAEDCNEVKPNDINYVHSIYAPLSVRLVQHVVKHGGWGTLSDILPLLPGPPEFDVVQPTPFNQNRRRASIGSQASSVNESPKVVLVFFLGGCTYAEISALRFLSQHEESNVEFIIATSKIINGKTFIQSLMEPLDSSVF